jgi:hypothetical protein
LAAASPGYKAASFLIKEGLVIHRQQSFPRSARIDVLELSHDQLPIDQQASGFIADR